MDDLNNTIREINIEKPNSFTDILNILKTKIKNRSEFYEILIMDKNNGEQIINTENYNKIEDILLIRKINKNNRDK